MISLFPGACNHQQFLSFHLYLLLNVRTESSVYSGNDRLPVDKAHVGELSQPIIFEGSSSVQQDRVGELILAGELSQLAAILLYCEANNDKPFLPIFLMEPLYLRKLLHGRFAERCEEMKQYDLVLKLR